MIVRRGNEEDLGDPEILDMLSEKAAEMAPLGVTLPKIIESLDPIVRANGIFLVAETGEGRAVGLYVAIPAHMPWSEKPILQDVFYASRAQGAMKALLEAAEAYAEGYGCGAILLSGWLERRDAWEKWASFNGYTPIGAVAYKEIRDGGC